MCYANQGRRKTQSLAYQHFPTSKIHDFNMKNLVPLKMQKTNILCCIPTQDRRWASLDKTTSAVCLQSAPGIKGQSVLP